MKIGVLALQGDVREHLSLLRDLGVAGVPVRGAEELETLDGIVLPGGESTTIGLLLAEHGMLEALAKGIENGLPAFGTCAGAIVLAREVRGGDVPKLGVLDACLHRNAYGRQVDSFEETLDVAGCGSVRGVFIRAPLVEEVGAGVEVLASHNDRPVVLRDGRILAATFHPEIAGEPGLHRLFVETVCG